MEQLAKDPMLPRPFTIKKRRMDLSDTFTIEIEANDGGGFQYAPGQFNMLYVFGTGEVPISISGAVGGPLIHTIRAVGAVTDKLMSLHTGDIVGIRGPFGTSWPVEKVKGKDVLFIAGGIGLAPLRPAILEVIKNRHDYGKVTILYGTRTPEDILYRHEVAKWRAQFDLDVEVTVDRADRNWDGRVGVVTKLIDRVQCSPPDTAVFVCGPEIMMHFANKALLAKGFEPANIYVSLERSMKCALGFCGHCQLGGRFVCKDGPVFDLNQLGDALTIKEF